MELDTFMTANSHIRDAFTKDEIREILDTSKFPSKDFPCPLSDLISYPLHSFHGPKDKEIVSITDNAFRLCLERDRNFITKNKKTRLLCKKEDFKYTEMNSFLAEIRTYGALLSVFNKNEIKTSGRNKKGADFHIMNINEPIASIETYAPQIPEKQSCLCHQRNIQPLEKSYQDGLYQGKSVYKDKDGLTTFYEATVDFFTQIPPFSYNHSAIVKLSQIKQEEKHQFSSTIPSILWIDLISFILQFNRVQSKSLFFSKPYNWHEAGIFWYGCYCKKDLPVKEVSRPEYEKISVDGLFLRNQNLSAVVLSFIDKIVLFENPYSANVLTSELREKIRDIDRFCNEFSWTYTSNDSLLKRVETEYKRIERYLTFCPLFREVSL